MRTTRQSGAEAREAALGRRVDRLMSDTRFDRLRTRPARVALVALGAVLVCASAPVYILGGPIWGSLITLLTFGTWWLLRLSIRTVADLPDRFLDERQLQVRNRAYLDAFRFYSSAVVALASVGLIAFIVRSSDDTLTVTITWDLAFGVVMFLILLPVLLPSMAVALRER